MHDIFNQTFSSDEAILEVMNIFECPWEDVDHHSSFIPIIESLKLRLEKLTPNDDKE